MHLRLFMLIGKPLILLGLQAFLLANIRSN